MTTLEPDPEPVRFDIDGVEHCGQWRGNRDARSPVFVLLHDGLGCIDNWRQFPDDLAAATGWPVFAYDRWGYGRSAWREAFPTGFMEDEAARLSLVLDAMKIQECVLVGHSDGGTIALVHGAGQAQRIRALVTMAAHVIVDPSSAGLLNQLETALKVGAPPQWLARYHGDRGPHLLGCWIDVWRREFDEGWSIEQRLPDIAAPLLAMQGAEDPTKIPAHLEIIAGAVRGAETRSLDGLGHFPHLERPDIVVREIVDFVDRNGLREPSR